MKTFSEWMLQKEMFTTPPIPSLTSPQVAGSGLTNAMPTGQAKLPKWKRTLNKPKASDDGEWR